MFNARRMPFSTNYLPLAGEPHDSDGHEAPWRRIKSSLQIWRTIAIFECLMIIVGTTLFVKSTASDPYPSFIHRESFTLVQHTDMKNLTHPRL